MHYSQSKVSFWQELSLFICVFLSHTLFYLFLPLAIPCPFSCYWFFFFFHVPFLFSHVLYLAVGMQATMLLLSTSVIKKKIYILLQNTELLFVTKSAQSDVCVLLTITNPVLRLSPWSSFLPH